MLRYEPLVEGELNPLGSPVKAQPGKPGLMALINYNQRQLDQTLARRLWHAQTTLNQHHTLGG